MVDGGVFRPIPSKTPLGVTEHHPYGPFCNFKHGRNPIFDEMVAFCPDLWLSLVGRLSTILPYYLAGKKKSQNKNFDDHITTI